MARRFLWIIGSLILLAVGGYVLFQAFAPQLMKAAMTPTVAFEAAPPQPPAFYDGPRAWAARPGLPNSEALWTPAGFQPAPRPAAALFYVAPTAYLGRKHWNMPLDDAESNERIGLYLKGQASAFNGVAEIWAPRYRQATFGAFLNHERPEAAKALALAYSDVETAFDAFLRAQPADRPIYLAGHSQGTLHLLRLMQERVAGKPLAQRIVAAYLVGWPISPSTDLPALGLPACARTDQAGCILSWQSFAEPAEPDGILEVFDGLPGLNGQSRQDSAMLCTNPLTGGDGGAAPADRNIGALVPSDAGLSSATLQAGLVPALCSGRGILSIGLPPEGYGASYVLPGNNYHVYDYALFWANVRADAEARLNAWTAAR